MAVHFEFNGIKIEKNDEDECQGSVRTQFHADEIYGLVNEVKKEDDVVIYEKLPWEQSSSEDDEQNEQLPFECNEENMIIETEIKVEEPILEKKMQQLDQVGSSSVTKATKPKKKENGFKKVHLQTNRERPTEKGQLNRIEKVTNAMFVLKNLQTN